MVVVRGAASSEEDSAGSWPRSCNFTMPNRHAINRQVAVNTLATMHRRFNIPSMISTSGRPLAEFRASANKSLDILRQNIQAAVTKDIDQVIKKYLETFFVPAVNNIRTNLGEESVSEEQLRAVCRAMLDGARSLYAAPPRPSVPIRPAPSPSELSDSESSNGADSRFGRPIGSPSYGKRKESDTDSDVGVGARRKRRTESNPNYAHKWDPARLTQDTLFIMGSIANKVLGLGQSRGRLYSKHSGLLRYPADSADKEWIANQNFKTSSGGKTYIMVLEDIEELIASEDYRHSSTLRLSELSCFRAPPFMLRKIQAYLSRRCEMSEDYASSTPTLTPPPVEPPIQSVVGQLATREDHLNVIGQTNAFNIENLENRIKIEDMGEQLINEEFNKHIKTEIDYNDTSQFCKDAQCIQLHQGNQLNPGPGGFTSIVSAGISPENNFWRSVSESQLLNDASKDIYDTNIKVEMNPAAELMDADIEFLSGDFCSYAESEADVKKSFDKITEGGNGMFLQDNTHLLSGSHCDMNSSHQDKSMISSLPDDMQNFVTSSNSLITFSSSPIMHSPTSNSYTMSNNMNPFPQALPSFSQISPLQAHLISSQSPQTSVQVTCVAWQPNTVQNAVRTVASLANTTRTMNSTVTPGPTLVGLANRTTGNIIASTGNFINITPKTFSSGNILHNALVSRNMMNRGLNANKVEMTRTLTNSVNTLVHRPPLVLPSVTTFSRTSVPSTKIEDDMSITTTKAMIDNTCNSSAMLKQVLTLGSAGVNKTFLTPNSQKTNASKPSSSSTLSASHATLSALLSGIDPSHSDKKCPFGLSKADK